MHFAEKLDRFISNAGNPFSRSEAKKFKPEVNALGFFVSAQQEKALTMLEWAARHIGARD
ncbi:hypothetical protein EGY04_11225 [Enterobacter roggenkampii]|uniref:hypothetical protein n=1 Tax=Enterobacter roggenkampii TaxID=1812935 RepID=UPI000F50AFB3|nr:hypothetical protein [Enterobacter roggenkampii]AYY05552.1 hypothetical protein EGY04_11225 [Enterobacter roggenkampii]ELT5303075.1 hypothetical protein [Enterobacter roggenkampii]MDD9238230.1 hypothetical protein [Enterobacter roggenkampii]